TDRVGCRAGQAAEYANRGSDGQGDGRLAGGVRRALWTRPGAVEAVASGPSGLPLQAIAQRAEAVLRPGRTPLIRALVYQCARTDLKGLAVTPPGRAASLPACPTFRAQRHRSGLSPKHSRSDCLPR